MRILGGHNGNLGRCFCVVLSAMFMFVANTALALDPNLTIAQFQHTEWTAEQGAPAQIYAISQSKDGFLWLGSAEGLFRFDGISFEKIPSLVTNPPRSEAVTALLGASTGEVWVGHYWGGVSVYRNGRLRDANPAPPTGAVLKIVEDKSGAIWVSSGGAHFASLRRYAGGKWTIVDQSWGLPPRTHIYDIMAAKNGDQWLAFLHQLAVLPLGAHRLQWVDEHVGERPKLAQLSNGQILVADETGVKALPANPPFVSKPFADAGQGPAPPIGSAPFVVDRDDALWLRNPSNNLEHIARPQNLPPGGLPIIQASADVYARKPGLSADEPYAIFQDREGNIWTGTDAGLDRFRSMDIVPVLGLSDRPTMRMVAIVGSHSGRIYGVAYGNGGAARPFKVEPGNIIETAEPSQSLEYPLCASQDGGAWYVSIRRNEFFDVRDGAPKKISLPAGPQALIPTTCIETGDGSFWFSSIATGLVRYDGTAWKPFAISSTVDKNVWATGPDGHGGALMYVALKYLVDVRNNTTDMVWQQKDNPIGIIDVIAPGSNAIFLGGETGLARYDGKSIQILRADRLPIFNHISGIIQTRRGQTWILTKHQLILVSSSDLDASFDHPDYTLRYRILDFHDGLIGSPMEDHRNHLAEAADGRVWMLTSEGYFWINPANLYSNKLPPPVAIRSLTAGGVAYPLGTSIMLPSGTSNLQIDYSSLSLRTPERNEARYKLDGVDKNWIDAGPRREAFYNNLGPGTYTFHVTASNDDGVWNKTGKTLAIIIPPTFLQSNLFFALCILAGAFVLWVLYQLRMRQLAAQYQQRLLERLSERERIARELHDTLLQSVQGLILRFQAATDQFAAGKPSLQAMEGALQRAESVLIEGRNRVKQLRLTDRHASLSSAFEETGKELALGSDVTFSVSADGTIRELHPIVRSEVASIGNEAMTNAFQHANARNIMLVMNYGRSRFYICVRDDGSGIEANILARGGREGHFGLQGMRERAQKIGGEISISCPAGQGTEISLNIPGHIAYAGTRSKGFTFMFRRHSIDG